MSSQEKQEIISELQDDRIAASSAISTQTRTIALGVLAVAWLLLSGTESSLDKFTKHNSELLCVASVSVSALLFDYLQYIFSLWETDSALKASLQSKADEDAGYDEKCWKRSVANTCFILKILAGSLSAIWLLVVISRELPWN